MKRSFTKVIGTGGVGTGEIYQLEGTHTLGREESRAGHLLPGRDFCKLHIILHYVSVLTGNMKPNIRVIPVSAIGDDSRGSTLRKELVEAGMDTKYLKTIQETPTLHSICIQYPDGSGGNITESQSACSKVDISLLAKAENELDAGTILLAVPEVPLKSRIEFIKMGALKRSFVAASFTSLELKELEQSEVLGLVNLLSVNMEEAGMLAGIDDISKPDIIISECINKLGNYNPNIMISVTDGNEGAYTYEEGKLDYHPAYPVNAVNTAGAGDAFMAGLLVGILKGQSITEKGTDSCLKFAAALAGMSVTSRDTIHFGITPETLDEFISGHGIGL